MESTSLSPTSVPFLLKVQILPAGDTTVLRVEEDTNVSEIIHMLEEKKLANYQTSAGFTPLIMMNDTSRVEVFDEITLKNYKQIEKFVLENRVQMAANMAQASPNSSPSTARKIMGKITALGSSSAEKASSTATPDRSSSGERPSVQGPPVASLAAVAAAALANNPAPGSDSPAQSIKNRLKGMGFKVMFLKTKMDSSLALAGSGPNSASATDIHQQSRFSGGTNGSAASLDSVHNLPQHVSGSMMGTAQKALALQKKKGNTNTGKSASSMSMLGHSSTGSGTGSTFDLNLMTAPTSGGGGSNLGSASHDGALQIPEVSYGGGGRMSDAPSSGEGLGSVGDLIVVSGCDTRESTMSKATPSLAISTDKNSLGNPDDLGPVSAVESEYIDLDGAADQDNYEGMLKPDVILPEADFIAKFNPSTGLVWKMPVPSITTTITAASPGESDSGEAPLSAAPSATSALSAMTISPVTPNGSKGVTVFFRFYYAAEPVVYMKISGLVKLEHFCQKMCSRKNVDYELHSLEYGEQKSARPAEMDLLFSHYNRPGSQLEITLVKKGKSYSSIVTKEGDEPVMIVNQIDGRPLIVACKRDKIFELMSDLNFEDEKFSNVIFLTYRSFATSDEFLTHLIRTFYCKLSDTASEAEMEAFNKAKVPTQLKVLKVLHNWIEHHWHDFGLNSDLRAVLGAFLHQLIKNVDSEFSDVARGLLFVADIQRRWFEDLLSTYSTGERKQKKIASMFESLEPDEIAEQLCIHNGDIFRNIHPIEFLNEIWKKVGDESSPSFKFFVERFDKESYWVATELLACIDPKKRVLALKKFIYLVRRCLEVNNFFSVFSLISGLNLIPVQRLKTTWENLSDKSKGIWAEVEKIADPSRNMKNYRERLIAAVPPMVPFLPLYLKDLTFINDGNASKTQGIVNVDKLRMMANRVQEIVHLGSALYPFERKSAILNYIEKPSIITDLNKLKEVATKLELAHAGPAESK